MARALSREQELQRTSRALRTLSGSNHALLRLTDRQALLKEICRVVVEEAGYGAAIVIRVDGGDPPVFTPLAILGHEAAFQELHDAHWFGADADRSATSVAVRTGQPCLVNDVPDNPDVPEGWRDFNRRHGFGSVLSLPLRLEGQVYGALTIVAPEADAFDDFERAPLEEAAADLAFGLETLLARERHTATEQAMQRLMLFDPVSGLPNKANFRRMLGEALRSASDATQPLTVIRLAIDRLQDVDVMLGSSIADRVVEQVARRLESALAANETLAQLADTEFAVIVADTGAEKGRLVARRLADAMAEPFEMEGLQLDVRLVCGLAVCPGHGSEADALVRRAGIALVSARHQGAGIAVFSNALDMGCVRNISLMADLRRAISNGELRLYCQPKVEIAPRLPCGLEALVRWEHPSKGLLNPNEFIHVAESTGLITPLTYWVLEDTLRQAYAWRAAGIAQTVSVNMSAHDLRDDHFLERVSDKLATWGAQPGAIEFELTESALMQDPAKALEVLHGLKRLDVRLSIDDFGTGYSSLSYLSRLPVDTIKIDQSFVRGMIADPGCAAIVKSTIDLAHNLKLHVIAEGVEDDATFDALGNLGCDAAQGFSIGRPMPVSEFGAWLDRRTHH